jgi:hypothetical protein
MIENVPLMIAWLPTTEARIAKISTGHLTLSAAKILYNIPATSHFLQPKFCTTIIYVLKTRKGVVDEFMYTTR